MSLQDFNIISEIGKGSYSSVYKVKRKSDGKQYALKKVRLPFLKEKEKSNALNEVRILASITSQYIISYKQAFIEDANNSLCIIMQFADGGDLQHKIDNTIKRRTYFVEKEIWKIIKDMLSGLKILHDMNIVHRDIKTANIFISGGLYKLGDLNVSKILQRGLAYTQTGTPYYASPEVWRDQPYDSKSDIWSIGCVIYQICTLHPPFQAKDMQGLYKKVQHGRFDRIPGRYSQDLQRFIEICLQLQPYRRPNCHDLLQSPFLQGKTGQFGNQQNDLLDTIQLPKNLQRLKGLLPKSKYMQTQTTSQRIPSRKSNFLDDQKIQTYLPFNRRNPSESKMAPHSLAPQHIYQNKLDSSRDKSNNYHQKRLQGIYDIPKHKVYSHYHDQVSQLIDQSSTNNKRINQSLQNKLQLRQKHLLGAIPNNQYGGNSNNYRTQLGNPHKLPSIINNQRSVGLSLKTNQTKPNYQYSRPSWWG